MRIKNIHIIQFRNHADLEFSFESRIIAITGKNGTGKTSILDAIFYLCTGRSHFQNLDFHLIQNGMDYFNLSGEIEREKTSKVFVGVQVGKRKNIKVNGETYSKLSEHYGKFPCVMIAPNDVEIITEGSEIRRSFIDSAISIYSSEYLVQLNKYIRIVQQRNASLKQINESGGDRYSDLILSYNEELIPLNKFIFGERKNFIEKFEPFFQEIYKSLSQQKEKLEIKYISTISSDLKEQFTNSERKDIILQRTNTGIHKDDIQFLIDEMDSKKAASQGQIKSIVLSLKIGLMQFLKSYAGINPLLMLDDISDRLYEQRLFQLFQLLEELKVDQYFLTDTSKRRLESLLIIKDAIQWIDL